VTGRGIAWVLAAALLLGGAVLALASLCRCRHRHEIWRRHPRSGDMGLECAHCRRWRPAAALRPSSPPPRLTAPVAAEAGCHDVIRALERQARIERAARAVEARYAQR